MIVGKVHVLQTSLLYSLGLLAHTRTGQRVYFIICPTHQVSQIIFFLFTRILQVCSQYTCFNASSVQLKNMVAALYQSRCSKGGTRTFVHGEGNFAWEVIEEMYKHETERKRTGQCVRVPKLKANHMYRDSWTPLNVLPLKVMQVSNGSTSISSSIY